MGILTPAIDLRTDVETKLSYGDGFTTTTDTTIAMVNKMIVSAAGKLAAKIRSSDFGDDYFVQSDTVTLNTTKGYVDTSVDLTDNFYRLRKLAWLRNSGQQPLPIAKASIDQTYLTGLETGGWGGTTPLYRLAKERIVFYPEPSSTVTVLITYDTDMAIADDLDSTIELYPGWRDWIVYDTCIQVLQREKDETRASYFTRERDAQWDMMLPTASLDGLTAALGGGHRPRG